MRVLEGYTWPGNVRELENTIQRACVLATSDLLTAEGHPARRRDHAGADAVGPGAAPRRPAE